MQISLFQKGQVRPILRGLAQTQVQNPIYRYLNNWENH